MALAAIQAEFYSIWIIMTDKYGLIGSPLTHSFSKEYFNSKFRQEQINAIYELYPLADIDLLPRLIAENPELKGLNVTIPYKKQVLRFLNEVSPEAGEIGAVNTIGIVRKGKSAWLKGWNTDAAAFGLETDDFTGNVTGSALILGTGGAAAAAAYSLKNKGWAYRLISRTGGQPGNPSIMRYEELNRQIMEETTLIVNASPAGMYPDTEIAPAIPWQWINKKHFLFDMIYNPPVTRFLAIGEEKGAKTRNGLGMLHKQAALAWDIWQTLDAQEK